jgi:hypothetical protein
MATALLAGLDALVELLIGEAIAAHLGGGTPDA